MTDDGVFTPTKSIQGATYLAIPVHRGTIR